MQHGYGKIHDPAIDDEIVAKIVHVSILQSVQRVALAKTVAMNASVRMEHHVIQSQETVCVLQGG